MLGGHQTLKLMTGDLLRKDSKILLVGGIEEGCGLEAGYRIWFATWCARETE
jgi:hypothetical protein